MKNANYILFIILFPFILGCHPELKDILPIQNDGSIQFKIKTPDKTFTRGLPIENANNISEMSIYGYYTGNGDDYEWSEVYTAAIPNFMCGTTITNSGYTTGTNNWTYSPTIYWPSYTNSNVTFYAYYPIASSTNGLSIVDSIGGLTFNYNAPTVCTDQPDLMLAVPQFNLTSGTVSLAMKHALTCIGFSAIGSYDVIETIEVTNVSVGGTVAITGTDTTFTWTLDDPVSTAYSPTYNDSVIDNTTLSIVTSNGYLLLPPQTLGTDALLTVTTKYGVTKKFDLSGLEWKAGEYINYVLDLKISNTDIIDTVPNNYFVGAFWKYNETAERIIRMSNEGYWEAFVLCTDDQWDEEDIMIDGLAEGNPTTQGVAISGDPLQMIDTQTKVYGSGDISFRIGLTTTTTLDSAQAAPRYAIVLLRYDNYTKNHLIYLRQGEAADVIAGSAKFPPYNISSTAYEFTDYPTKAGGYKQWSPIATMYLPSGSTPSGTVSTDTIANICPTGYSIPTQDDFRDVIYGAYYGASGGLYADGYFDRQTITYSEVNNGSTNIDCPTVGSGDSLAYAGILCYNTNTYASNFFQIGRAHV